MIFAHLIQVASALPTDASALESAMSALESAITALDSSSRLWEILTWVFTGMVVVGVAIEIRVLVLEHREEMTEWKRGIVRPPDKPSRSLFTWGLIGSILVALGVAGEFGVGIEVALLNGELRTKNTELRHKSNQLVTLLTKETEDESSARAKLEASVAWRRLSKEQQSAIAANLKQFPGVRVGVSYLGGNPEASQFANDIAVALPAAQLNTPPLEPFSLFGGYGGGVYPLHPSTGVNVSTTGERGRNASEALQRELCSMGFDTAVTPKPPVRKTDGTEPKIDVVVLVVARPITPQGAATLTINSKTRTCTSSQ